MSELIPNIAGWLPAVILPVASLLQLVKIVRERSAEGVSLLSWFLFGIANIGVYIFTEKYFAIQAIVGLLGTAVLNFIIAFLVVRIRRVKDL